LAQALVTEVISTFQRKAISLLEKPSVTQDQNMYVAENSMHPRTSRFSGPIYWYVDDGFFRSFYVNGGIFRHMHALVLRQAWFF
jgi:hypothetical protein